MSFEEDFETTQKEMSSTSDFYKFKVGAHVMRIMSEPVKKAQRFGYGVCYPGAPYCDPAALQKEFDDKQQEYADAMKAARAKGASERELKAIKKPSRSNISVKWSVWALVRSFTPEKGSAITIGELAIVDLPNGVAEKLLGFKRDKDMGTSFDGFPMPYDVKVVVTRKKVANPGPKDIEYDIVASQKHADVTDDELAMMEKKTSVADIVERMGVKAKEKFEGGGGDENETSGGVEYPKDDINPDDIPF